MGKIDTDAIRRLADQFQTDVGAKLYAAKNTLQKAKEIEYSNFTTLHVPLAITYVEAFNFQNTDVEQKAQAADDFRLNLRSSADAWDKAEHANTQHPDGPR